MTELKTIEDLEKTYGSGTHLSLEEEFNKRYKGKTPQEIAKQAVKDINAFECGYGLQARVWREIRNADMSSKDLVALLIAHPIMKNEVAEKLAHPKYANELDADELAIIARYVEPEQTAYLLNEILKRNDVSIGTLLEVADETETGRRLVRKAADSLVARSKQEVYGMKCDAKNLIDKVLSYFYEKPERQQFANEIASSLQDIVYKYLAKDVSIDALQKATDVKQITRAVDILVKANEVREDAKQYPTLVNGRAENLIDKVLSYFYEKPEREQFANEVASNLRDVVYKYLEK